jgi:hypothetical protein
MLAVAARRADICAVIPAERALGKQSTTIVPIHPNVRIQRSGANPFLSTISTLKTMGIMHRVRREKITKKITLIPQFL